MKISKYAIGAGLLGTVGMQVLPQQIVYDITGTINSIGNFGFAGYTFAVSAVDYWYNLRGLTSDTDEYYTERSKIHKRTADRILRLSVSNKGIYLKFGQYLGNLERVVPKEYSDVLKVLQDSGPQVPFSAVNTVILTDFGKNIDEVFDDFERTAIAAASLAQVHKAKYKGQTVAVKIQFPTLRSQFDKDIRLLGYLVRIGEKILNTTTFKNINFSKIFTTFSASLRDELDFTTEMANGEKTKKLLSDDDNIFIPDYIKEVCGSRVLTMDFIYGVKINQKAEIEAQGFDPKEVADLLLKAFATMIFQHGHVHCDAHPGNILVRPNPRRPHKPQLVLLDHGFYRSYNQEFLQKYCELWQSLILQDYDKLKEVSEYLGIGEYYKYMPLVLLWRSRGTKKLGDLIPEEERKRLQKADVVNFETINMIMQRLPEHMIFIIRASNLTAIHNMVLGGTMRNRFVRNTEACYAKLYPNVCSRRLHLMAFRVRLWIMENLLSLYQWMFPAKAEVF